MQTDSGGGDLKWFLLLRQSQTMQHLIHVCIYSHTKCSELSNNFY